MTRALAVVLVSAVLAAVLAGGQTITVNVDLVNIPFTVCNKKGRFITDLLKENFAVFEDGRPQAITRFTRETDLPLTIALLIDTSGSVRDKLSFEQEAAVEFFYLLRLDLDKALVFTFDTDIHLRQDYTDDPQLLASAVRNIRSGGGTRLYDALYVAVSEKLAGQDGRRVVILISDGDDKSSRRSPGEVVELAQRNDVTIYSISMNAVGTSQGDTDRADKVLKTFAEETGGKAFFPARLKELPASFSSISKELRAQYTLAYRSSNFNRDGSFRKIRIDVVDKRYSVRARSGYYAPRETTAHK